jgi:hypothetical protein
MTPQLIGGKGFKLWIVRALFVLVVADLVLGAYVWRTIASHPQSERIALESLRARHRQYGDDLRRAELIQTRLPEVERECNRFFDAQFLNTSTGYSSVVEDLGRIARTAGLPPSAISFKQHEIEKRGVVEVAVTATVEGEYPALVRFINGLERSEHLYLLDSLILAEAAEKRVKLNLQMKTYFRVAG